MKYGDEYIRVDINLFENLFFGQQFW